MGTLAIIEDPDEMPHYSALFVNLDKIDPPRKTYNFLSCNRCPLTMM